MWSDFPLVHMQSPDARSLWCGPQVAGLAGASLRMNRPHGRRGPKLRPLWKGTWLLVLRGCLPLPDKPKDNHCPTCNKITGSLTPLIVRNPRCPRPTYFQPRRPLAIGYVHTHKAQGPWGWLGTVLRVLVSCLRCRAPSWGDWEVPPHRGASALGSDLLMTLFN